jgi:hypothetical protein
VPGETYQEILFKYQQLQKNKVMKKLMKKKFNFKIQMEGSL